MDVDHSRDFLVWDNVQAGTLYRRTSESPVAYDAGTALTNVLMEQETNTESPGPGGAMLTRKRTFLQFSRTQAGDPFPKAGDEFRSTTTGATYVLQPGGSAYSRSLQLWRVEVQQVV